MADVSTLPWPGLGWYKTRNRKPDRLSTLCQTLVRPRTHSHDRGTRSRQRADSKFHAGVILHQGNRDTGRSRVREEESVDSNGCRSHRTGDETDREDRRRARQDNFASCS